MATPKKSTVTNRNTASLTKPSGSMLLQEGLESDELYLRILLEELNRPAIFSLQRLRIGLKLTLQQTSGILVVGLEWGCTQRHWQKKGARAVDARVLSKGLKENKLLWLFANKEHN